MSDRTVLLVDDQVDFLDTLQKLLESDGYEVLRAENAAQALAHAAASEPVCMLVDHRMAGVSGTELVREIRKRFGSGMVIVMCTGHADTDHREHFERAGADIVLPKPLDLERLRAILPPL
jgi:DNA-binding response OmpR family regulator